MTEPRPAVKLSSMRYGRTERGGRTAQGRAPATSVADASRLSQRTEPPGVSFDGVTGGTITDDLCPSTKLMKPECSCVECSRELVARYGLRNAARRMGNERARRGDRQLALPADVAELPTARRFVDSAAVAFGLDEAARYQVTTAANEAVSNAIRHGAPFAGGVIYLSTWLQDDELVCTVQDRGTFDLLGNRTPDPAAEQGRGLPLMHLLMDQVVIDATPRGTIVRLSKRAPKRASTETPCDR